MPVPFEQILHFLEGAAIRSQDRTSIDAALDAGEGDNPIEQRCTFRFFNAQKYMQKRQGVTLACGDKSCRDEKSEILVEPRRRLGQPALEHPRQRRRLRILWWMGQGGYSGGRGAE